MSAGTSAPGGLSRGHLWVALAASSWGTWSLFLKPAERMGPLAPAMEALVVMGVIAVSLLPLGLRDLRARPLGRGSTAALFALGITDAGNLLLFFAAMSATTLPVAVLTHCSAPILVALASPLVTDERFRPRTLGFAALAVVGLTLLLAPWRAGSVPVTGALYGGASAFFYAANVLLQKRLGAHVTAAQSMSFHAIVSVVVIFFFVPAGGTAILPGQAAILVGAAVLLATIAGTVFVAALATIPASHASVLALLEPFVAVILGVVVWGDPLGPTGALGAVVMLAALVGVVRG